MLKKKLKKYEEYEMSWIIGIDLITKCEVSYFLPFIDFNKGSARWVWEYLRHL